MGFRRWLLGMILFVILLGGCLAGLAALLRHEPGFYQRCLVTAGAEREELADQFLNRAATLIGNLFEGTRDEWWITLSESQINSFLQEKFPQLGDSKILAQQGVSDPRILMEQDRIRLAFRYGHEPLSTVVSVDFKIWLASKELNVFVVEILGRRAGAMPISSQSLLEEIKDLARRHHIEVDWYRNQGNPVAVLKIQNTNQPRTQLTRLEMRSGMLTIRGKPLPLPNAKTKGVLAPVGN